MRSTSQVRPEDILVKLPEHFRGGPPGRRLRVVYEFYEEGYRPLSTWSVTVEGDSCAVQEGLVEPYDSRVFIKREDYQRLTAGEMDYGSAIWLGRIRIEGSWLAHQELNTYFTFPVWCGYKMV